MPKILFPPALAGSNNVQSYEAGPEYGNDERLVPKVTESGVELRIKTSRESHIVKLLQFLKRV